MPGPKMGPRPSDFDEEIVRQSPTFIKWEHLAEGQTLRYACREFMKGYGDDEERLMRRIMIARRNNLKDHATLKRARKQKQKQQRQQSSTTTSLGTDTASGNNNGTVVAAAVAPPCKRARITTPNAISDAQILKEMDIPAVEATRSYRAWLDLEDGKEFVYNQRYIKGKENHDWLLRKNIWRRMRYRRENKQMVEEMKGQPPEMVPITTTTTVVQQQQQQQGQYRQFSVVHPAPTEGTTVHLHLLESPSQHVFLDNNNTTVNNDNNNGTINNAVVGTTGTIGVAPLDMHIPVQHPPAAVITAAAAAADSLTAAGIVDHALEADFCHKEVVEAAIAATESYVKEDPNRFMDSVTSSLVVVNPLETSAATTVATATNEALMAAAKLAAAAAIDDDITIGV